MGHHAEFDDCSLNTMTLTYIGGLVHWTTGVCLCGQSVMHGVKSLLLQFDHRAKFNHYRSKDVGMCMVSLGLGVAGPYKHAPPHKPTLMTVDDTVPTCTSAQSH